MNLRTIWLACGAACAPAAVALAQSSPDSLGWHFVGNLGYVQTSGNTRLSTVNLGDKLIWLAAPRWTFTQTAAWVYGKNDSTVSANQVLASLRADYNISSRLSAFGLVDYEANPPSAISSRTEELAGLAFKLIAKTRQTLSVDVGAGLTQLRSGGVSTNNAIARVAPLFHQAIGAHAYVEEGMEFIENLKDTGALRATSASVLVAPLTAAIGIRVSYLMRYDAEPAPAAAPLKKLDTTFTTGIQITL